MEVTTKPDATVKSFQNEYLYLVFARWTRIWSQFLPFLKKLYDFADVNIRHFVGQVLVCLMLTYGLRVFWLEQLNAKRYVSFRFMTGKKER